jgi:hypothetical protein
MRRQGAARIVVAVPVAPEETLAEIAALADDVVCLNPARDFIGVGGFFADFHQLTDEETIGLLHQSWNAEAQAEAGPRMVSVPPHGLAGDLTVPAEPRGIVLFAHGSGSSRLSPRNRAVAASLNAQGFATLLMDLLTPDEARDRRNVFDIPLLAQRLAEAALWITSEPDIADLPLGLFGASTGAGAALLAAALFLCLGVARADEAAFGADGGTPAPTPPVRPTVTAAPASRPPATATSTARRAAPAVPPQVVTPPVTPPGAARPGATMLAAPDGIRSGQAVPSMVGQSTGAARGAATGTPASR